MPRAAFADVLRAPDDLDSLDALPDITAHKLCCKMPNLSHLKLPVRLPQSHWSVSLGPALLRVIACIYTPTCCFHCRILQWDVDMCALRCTAC